MKILLFGKNGQVGKRLSTVLLPLGELVCFGSNDLDLRDFDKLRECIINHKPNVIVNAAAYTQVDKAELEVDNAFTINALAVKVMAEEAVKINSWLIHYSTDYVFDGSKNGAYTEHDTPNPLSIYGKSKLAGDHHISSICKQYLILRTTWVFDSYGKNFPKTILALAQNKDTLRVIDDQFGAPTHASLIANVTAFILYKIMLSPNAVEDLSGIYNVTASGEISWHGFAYALIKQAHEMGYELNCLTQNIIPIETKDYPTPAKRPYHSRLDTTKLTSKFALAMPGWNLYIEPLLQDLKLMSII